MNTVTENPFLMLNEHGKLYFLETKINLTVLMDKYYIRFTDPEDYTILISDLLMVCKQDKFMRLQTFNLGIDTRNIYHLNLYSQDYWLGQDFVRLTDAFLSFVQQAEYYDFLGKMSDKDYSDYYDIISQWLKPWVLNYQLHQKLDKKLDVSRQKI